MRYQPIRHWTHAATGFLCVVVRDDDGALYGYVGVGRTNGPYGIELGAKTLDYAPFDGGGILFAGLSNISRLFAADERDLWWFAIACRSGASQTGNDLSIAEAITGDLAAWLAKYPSI